MILTIMVKPHQLSSLRTALAMGVIDQLAASDEPKAATDLARATKCDKLLVGKFPMQVTKSQNPTMSVVRILRVLCTIKIVDEVGYKTYAANARTKFLTLPSVTGSFKIMSVLQPSHLYAKKFRFDIAAKCIIHMPEFLSKTGFKNPVGPMGTFQSAFNTEL